MNGFGFIEYEDAMDARDVVPGKIGFVADLALLTTSQHSVCAWGHPLQPLFR